jgi:hypothetical protein
MCAFREPDLPAEAPSEPITEPIEAVADMASLEIHKAIALLEEGGR